MFASVLFCVIVWWSGLSDPQTAKLVPSGSNRLTDAPSCEPGSYSVTDGVVSSLRMLGGAEVEAWGDR